MQIAQDHDVAAPQGDVDTSGALDFFRVQHKAFRDTLETYKGKADLLDRLWMQAFTSFERNVEEQTRELPQLACRKGCGTCCQILVAATAPEVLMVARYVRGMAPGFRKVGIDIIGRLMSAEDFPHTPPQEGRAMALVRECPFLVEGMCIAYPVRPLACRGHASFNENACVSALLGGADDVPVSEPHRTVRGLVQNALQSALRDTGYTWVLYDLVAAVKIALTRPDAEDIFAGGGDVLAPAMIDHVSREEMAAVFDRLKA